MRVEEAKRTFGFQTRKGRVDSVTRGLSMTGLGHFHCERTRKNLFTSVAGAAFGYSWQIRAVSSAQLIPPACALERWIYTGRERERERKY
jgi:hypothetical protein